MITTFKLNKEEIKVAIVEYLTKRKLADTSKQYVDIEHTTRMEGDDRFGNECRVFGGIDVTLTPMKTETTFAGRT